MVVDWEGAIETGLNKIGPKRNPTEKDIVRGRLHILFHESPLQFHKGGLTQPNMSLPT